MNSRPRFKIHKGGLAEPTVSRQDVSDVLFKVLVDGPYGKVWCLLTSDENGRVVRDDGTWIKPDGEDEFLVANGREPGYVARQLAECRPIDEFEFVTSYLRFLYEEIRLGRTEDWK